MLRSLLSLLLLACCGDGFAKAARVAAPVAAEQVDAAMTLPGELQQLVEARRPLRGLTAQERMQSLVDFMADEEGLALRYQEQPTYGIAESYAKRRVNCLSFTLMFIALARASGVRAHAQVSDDALAMRVLGDTVYRATHVNAGVEISGVHYTVDVGWRSLLVARQPRIITDAQAVALLHNNNAVERLLSGDNQVATTEIETALALDPGGATAWSNAGVVYWRSGRHSAAEQAYLKALKLRRNHIGALSNLVVMHRELGDVQLEEAYAKRLRRAQAKDPFSQFLIAQGLAESGAYEEAITHFRRAIRLLPDEPQFHRDLAEVYRKQGKVVAAARARDQADRLEALRASRRGIRDVDVAG